MVSKMNEESKQKTFVNTMNRKRKILTHEMKQPHSKVERIPIEYYTTLQQLGNGDFKKGLRKALFLCNSTDITNVLMNDCNLLMDHLQLFYNENHNHHFKNFPAFFLKFLQTGDCDFKILKGENKNAKSNPRQTS